jgi:SPP1 family predicted phage head-tail adaptor
MMACALLMLALRDTVTLQSKSTSRNAIGEEVVSWADVATLRAEVKPIRGREWFDAAQVQQSVDLRVIIRTRTGVTADMRLRWKSESYDITAVIPGSGDWRGTLELMAVKGVRNGR